MGGMAQDLRWQKMNQLQTFVNDELGFIRSTTLNDQPWFVGKDVAVSLGYTNPPKAIRDHVDEEDKTVNESFTVNGTSPTLINESGVYSLIFRSKLESAKKFKHWVTSEVLPAIRKNGMYANVNPEYRFKCAELLSRTPIENVRSVAYVMGFDIPQEYGISLKRQKSIIENPLKAFLEPIRDTIKQYTPIVDLWNEYLIWCNDNDCEPISRISFGRKLSEYTDREIISKKINRSTVRVLQ